MLTKEQRIALATRVRLGETYPGNRGPFDLYTVADGYRVFVLGVHVGTYSWKECQVSQFLFRVYKRRVWADGFVNSVELPLEAAILEYLERE